ncbi:MAG TPA: CerR family C-terminal domain-containing protein [Smithella sp.]|nr:CerR family C-terminal domain-containing protein [Smithella sp.]
MEAGDNRKKVAIIEAAGEIFVKNGFQNTTTRQICERAGVNVNAINYYFTSKKNLYIEVLHYYRDIARGQFMLAQKIEESDTPQQKIKVFIHAAITHIFDEGRPTWFGKLIAREYVEPTGALDILVKEVIRPNFMMLSAIIKEILGEEASEETAHLCQMSIMAQCLYFRNSPQIATRLLKKKKFSQEEIAAIEEHICRFSLAALENYRKV